MKLINEIGHCGRIAAKFKQHFLPNAQVLAGDTVVLVCDLTLNLLVKRLTVAGRTHNSDDVISYVEECGEQWKYDPEQKYRERQTRNDADYDERRYPKRSNRRPDASRNLQEAVAIGSVRALCDCNRDFPQIILSDLIPIEQFLLLRNGD